jgi:hypothetical protein
VQHEVILTGACDESVAAIRRELGRAGFRVEQSFDLRSALTLVPNCPCPHHGTARCDCQYTVLLIYGQALTPASLIVHGHDHQCWIALADDPNGRDAKGLATDILHTLAVAHLITTDQAGEAALQAAASG